MDDLKTNMDEKVGAKLEGKPVKKRRVQAHSYNNVGTYFYDFNQPDPKIT